MSESAYVYVSYIRATPQAVWSALTDGVSTKKFWYGRTHQSDWKKGSPLKFIQPNGDLDFEGEVLESDPPQRLVFTFNTGSDEEKTAGPSRVTYDIALVDGVARLTITHDRFPANSAVRKGVSNGWPAVISGLKTLLETGDSIMDGQCDKQKEKAA